MNRAEATTSATAGAPHAAPDAVGGAPRHAFGRIWRGFMVARAIVALALLGLQIFVVSTHIGGPAWLLAVNGVYVVLAMAGAWWIRPAAPRRLRPGQWLLTIGVDLLVLGLLQRFQLGALSYTPLLVLPVLLAAIVGPLSLGLATASGTTLYLLCEVALLPALSGKAHPPDIVETGLSGLGFLAMAFVANLLSRRLAREEAVARSSQAEAREQAQVNALVIEGLSEGVLVADVHGVVRSANPAAQRMLMGATGPEGVRLLLPGRPGWEALTQLVERTFATGGPIETELEVHADGLTPHRLRGRSRLTCAPAEGQGLCVVFLEDLREVEARVRTEKLAAMGRMSAAVAHEIRNPLAAITQANALLDEEVTDPAQRRLIRMIDENARRLARIVNDILNVARVQASGEAATALPLDPALRQITADWAHQHQVGSALGVHTHAEGALIGFDPDHLRRLLVNLLDNARRHASGQPSSIRVISQPAGPERVRLSVWSDGLPLEAGVRQHLFEPFFSSESRSSGLGLYLCRELCERYGAQLGYQRSTLDLREGNEFFVFLPLLPPPGGQPAPRGTSTACGQAPSPPPHLAPAPTPAP